MMTMWQGVLGVIVRLASSILFINMAGVTIFHMGLATPISSFCQDILCVIYLVFVLKKLKEKYGAKDRLPEMQDNRTAS